MDELDVSILGAMGFEPFVSPPKRDPWKAERLAEQVDASPRLVKDRVARLEREAIAGYEAFPHPAVLGYQHRSYALRSNNGRLLRLDGLKGIARPLLRVEFLSEWALVGFAYRDDEDRDEALTTLASELDATPVTWFAPYLPPSPRLPSNLDWKIIAALRADPRQPMHGMAKQLGVTRKTIQRRLAALHENGTLDVFPRLDIGALENFLFCMLQLEIDPKTTSETIRSLHQQVLNKAWSHCDGPMTDSAHHYDLTASVRTPRAVRDLVEATDRVTGVRSAQAHVASSVVWDTAWMDDEIRSIIESGA